MNKLVKCDSCGLTLNVPQKNNDPVRIIRCPNCSHQLRVEFGPQPEDSGETFYGGGGKSTIASPKLQTMTVQSMLPQKMKYVECI